MKCPKCSYISFDYNQVCPKCKRDIASEQQRMNLPSFKCDPPFLLSSLIGGASESAENLRVGDLEATLEIHREIDKTDHDPPKADTNEISAHDFEDLGMNLDDENPELPDESGSETVRLDPSSKEAEDEIKFEEEPSVVKAEEEEPSFSFSEKEMEEEISLDLEDLNVEVDESDETALESLRGKIRGGMPLDEAEMVTMEIDKEGEGALEDMEDFDLDLNLEELEEKPG